MEDVRLLGRLKGSKEAGRRRCNRGEVSSEYLGGKVAIGGSEGKGGTSKGRNL